MAKYVLSNAADADLAEIYGYSYQLFGSVQADTYFKSLSACLNALATGPGIGRLAKVAIPNLLRHEHRSHIIFYLEEPDGIFVVRVLHRNMDVSSHLDEGDM